MIIKCRILLKKNNYLNITDKNILNADDKKNYKDFLNEYDAYKKKYNQK